MTSSLPRRSVRLLTATTSSDAAINLCYRRPVCPDPSAFRFSVIPVTCSSKPGPVTMRVRQPQTGVRRTLYGQTTLTGADRAQAPPGGGKASRWGYGSGGGQGAGHKRSYLPSVEKPLRCDEHQRSQASRGVGEGECSPQEATCREGAGHRHPKGGESGNF